MTTQLLMITDQRGVNTFGLNWTDTGFTVTLAQNVAQSLTIPFNTDAQYPNYLCIISYDDGLRVFVANNATATLPGGSFTASTTVLKPGPRYVKPGNVLSFITPDVAAYVTVSLYATQ